VSACLLEHVSHTATAVITTRKLGTALVALVVQ
jgi:hypothetical protein